MPKQNSKDRTPKRRTAAVRPRKQASGDTHHPSAQFLETVFEHFSDAVSIVGADGTLKYESPSVQNVLGYTADEMVGRNMSELVHPDDLQAVADTFAEGVAKGHGAVVSTRIRFLHKNGSWIHVEGTGVNLLEDPTVAGIVVNYRDISDRARMEQALQESEERYRALVENASEGVLVAQDGMVKFTNSKVLEATGYAPDELVSHSIADFLHPDDRDMVVDRHMRRLAGEDIPTVYPIRCMDKSGKTRWIELSSARITWNGRPASINHLRDISERVRMDQALKESEEKYRNLVERANDGIAIVQDSIMVYANPRLAAMLGKTPEEMTGTPIADYVHPDKQDSALARYRRRMDGQDVETVYDTALLHSNGQRVEVEVNAGIISYEEKPADLVIIRDISERKRTEEMIECSERRFRAVTENALDAIVILGGDGTVLYESPSMQRVLGYQPEDRIGKNPMELVHPDDLQQAGEQFAQILNDREQTLHVEIRAIASDGSERWLEVIGQNLLDNRDVGGIVANFRDITERKNAEEAVKRKLAVEQAIAGISSRFLGLNGLNEGIDRALEDIGNLTGASRAFLHLLGKSGETMELTHEWCAKGVAPHTDDLRVVPSQPILKLLEKRSSEDAIIVSDRSRLTPKDATLKAGLESMGVKSFLALAVRVNRQVVGFLGLHDPVETQLWEHDDLILLRVVSEIIGATLERKTAAEALRASEERYRLIAENASDVIWTMDPDANFTYVSPSVQQLSGYTPEEVMELGLPALADEESCEFVRQVLREAVTEASEHPEVVRKPITLEMLQKGKDGSRGWAEIKVALIRDSSGSPIGVQGVTRDITERKAAEEVVKRSEEYFKALTENIVDVIVVLNGDGSIRYKSESFDRMVGKTRAGRSPLEFVHPNDTARATKAFANLMKKPGATVQMEIRGQHRQGSWRYFDVIGKNMMDNPAVGGIVANFRDVTERKTAEEALRESEEHLRDLFENANDMIQSVDRDGTYVYVNRAWLDTLGYSAKDIGNLKIADIIHGDELAHCMEVFDKIRNGQAFQRVETVFVTRKGQPVHVEGNVNGRFREGEFVATRGIFRDITERKDAERQLRESEESFRTIFDNAAYGILIAGMESRRFYMANRAISEMTGYSGDELAQLDVTVLHPEESLRHVLEQFEKQAQGEITTARELPVKRKDGSVFYADITAAPITILGETYLMGIFSDTTERKQAEEALRDSEARYRVLADNVTDVIWTADMDFNFTYISPSVTSLRGYSVEEALAQTLDQAVTPESFETAAAILGQALEREKAGSEGPSEIYTAELEMNHKDGSTVWTETAAHFLRDSEGRATGILGVSRNITERKRAEQEKQRMEQQVLLSGRLAAVGQLAAGVAHELNNPLAAVQGYAQLLTSRKDLDESIRDDVGTIYREAQRASKITANLLSFSRTHEPERKAISLNKVIEESIELHAYRLRVNNISIHTDLQPDLPRTLADFHQLQQVFVNLITNAEQAMTEAHGHGTLTISSHRSGDAIEVQIADDGPGMPEDVLNRAFDPFFTTKEVGKGTGLGLSICFGILDQHNGRIRAESEPGSGTTITVEIPIVPEEPPQTENQQTASESTSR